MITRPTLIATTAAALLLAGCGSQLQADAVGLLQGTSLNELTDSVMQQVPAAREQLTKLQSSYSDAQQRYDELQARWAQLESNANASAESLRQLQQQISASAEQLQRSREALQTAVDTTSNTFNVGNAVDAEAGTEAQAAATTAAPAAQ